MKTLLLVLSVLFVTAVSHGQTNVYHPFPDSNAFWGMEGGNIFNLNLCYNTRYGINGDTIINSKSYRKIYSLYDSTLINPNSTYFAAVREQDKKVYTVIGSNPETILYDFNLSVGDTITYNYSLEFNTTDSFSRVVTMVDSALLENGTFRKRWIFEPNSNPPNYSTVDTVVEGIGSVCGVGLFNPLKNAWATNGDYFYITCFKHNDTVLFLENPECNRCFCTLLTSVNDDAGSEKCLIYPNPFSTRTTLYSDILLKDADLKIYNLYGQQVKQMRNVSGNTIAIDRDNLPCGLYFVDIEQDNKTISIGKLVIADN